MKTLLLLLFLAAPEDSKDKQDCLKPPDKIGHYAKTMCQTIDGITGCAYELDTMEFPQNQFWHCALVYMQNSCKLPFEPYKVICEPIVKPKQDA